MTIRADDEALEVERYELSEPPPYQFEVERRDFIRIFALLGGGLLVVSRVPRADAQESGRGAQGRSAPRDDRRVAAHRRQRPGHRLYGEDRDRAEHQDLAGAGDCRRVERAARRRHPDHGGYRSRAIRCRHIRLAIDTPHGAAAGPRSSGRAGNADRSSGGVVEDGSSGLTVKEGRVIGDGRAITFGELTKGQTLAGIIPADRGTRSAGAVVGAGDCREESERPRLRDRPARVHAGSRPSRDAARPGDPPERLRGHARVGGRQPRQRDDRRLGDT